MTERNHCLSSTLKHDSRLHSSVGGGRKWKRADAQKHGLFAQALIVPGKGSREFSASVVQLATT